MANTVYESDTIALLDGRQLYITPLKIHYLRDFMQKFSEISEKETEDEKLDILIECVAIAMKQYCPDIASYDCVEDTMDVASVYRVIEIGGGISFKEKPEEDKPVPDTNGSSWDSLDLVNLESRAFLLGIWKDFYELETSISMPELIAILNVIGETDYAEKKFLAAIQGIDLDKESGKSRQDEWTAMKERVFGQAQGDPKDVTSLRGQKAQEAGFGIGLGLNYEKIS